ncbi:MAG TPA: glycerophosphodiester phosphodiesterase family protein [Pseudolabrys sp.]|jgi:glycerophosphoryl diester phosphodiesterase|nr:glycerophosphodiester phosphodiesterase family protein [Pseudolabrys sp.]
MSGPDWLTAQPLAHRGLHDASAGVIENTAAAFSAAMAAGYGMETDLQISADGEAMVHHDDALGRLTEGSGFLADLTAAEIRAVRFKASSGRILTLGELCDIVAGRVTLLLELKSRFDGDTRLAKRTINVLAGYAGPVAVMSFDADLIEAVRHAAPGLRRGIVSERNYFHPEWNKVSPSRKRSMAWLLHTPRSRPQFIAYSVNDLPAAAPLLARRVFGLPLLTWTVRGEDERRLAARWADQIIFEGWRP